MSDVLWRRLGYMLSPQMDIYLAIAHLMKGKTVLDIGFGTGFGALQFVPYARKIYGIEKDEDAVRFAARCIPGIEWRWGDIERPITYLYRDMDVVVMIEVLEHLCDWEAALKNAREVLSPDGMLVISARNAFADLRKNDLHEREWTALEFVDALGQFFEDITLYDYTLSRVQDVTTRQTPLVAVARQRARPEGLQPLEAMEELSYGR